MNTQNTHGLLCFESCPRTGNLDRFLAVAAFLTGNSEIRQWWGLSKTTNIEKDWPRVERARVAGAAETNRDLKRRVTMLCDQTFDQSSLRDSLTARDRDRLAPHFAAGESATTAVLGLIT
jgi:hypothetical protein